MQLLIGLDWTPNCARSSGPGGSTSLFVRKKYRLKFYSNNFQTLCGLRYSSFEITISMVVEVSYFFLIIG